MASLAKGLGVPIAFICGSAGAVAAFEARSETRVHCSPPSVAHLRATEHALQLNAREGDAAARHLARLVRRFRRGLGALGFRGVRVRSPVQTIGALRNLSAGTLHDRLQDAGIRSVLHVPRAGTPPAVSIVFTARHSSGTSTTSWTRFGSL